MGKSKSKNKRRSSSDDSSSSSSDASEQKKKLRELKMKLKKEKRKTEKALKKKLKELKKQKKLLKGSTSQSPGHENETADIPIELMEKSKAMAPMTKEEWEKKQSVIRRVLDEETGRHRLIKGDGEVLEEIVSYDRHKQINQQATRADGDFFQMKTINK
ncbi:ADP-ribosylation factor-like protein 6-interacting protein 4 isoform X1 [Leptidea sinapis]|uniref:ADP-ribosylation factor-like protein 6-interacting protein 4 isoform X1 n=2 Tax=Leptidea sinapis TaxID=189913 RepID=UPI00212D67A0|nr:ADP-ribosylation factor-like protein 6-interacting protein 4 isoform X1 [Leptidea sinapis]